MSWAALFPLATWAAGGRGMAPRAAADLGAGQIVDGYESTTTRTTRTSRCCGAVLGRALICVTNRGLNDEPRVPS